jgi:prepilin-type N-terminal cleavage/methylation domain-containing protein
MFGSGSARLGSRMRIKFCNIKIGKVNSEKGFTLLELIFVTTVTGILSSTLVLPFMAGLKQGTRPEIYTTATYLAQKEIEELKNAGYTIATGELGNVPSSVTFFNGTPREITYTEDSVREYVSHSGSTFTYSATPTEFIRVTETVSNTKNSDVVTLWAFLAKDFYNPNAN